MCYCMERETQRRISTVTEMTATKQAKLERIFALEDEIAYAKSQLLPQDTGHISTAIGWLGRRVRELKDNLDA